MDFICSLHQHTDASLHDGFATLPDVVSRAKELGYEALADTNHGTVSDLVQFYKECKKQGIKPILGMEAYFVHDINLNESPLYHMLFLAKDMTGYKNLMKLDTYAHEHFYKKPRIDMAAIAEFHEGLICSTACIAGVMRQDEPEEDMYQLYDIFKDDLYCELQPHPTEDQKAYNHKVYDFAQAHGHKCIITLDAHYVRKEDAPYHRYWLILGEESDYYSTPTYHLMDTKEVKKFMIDYHGFSDDVVDNCFATIKEVVDKCNVEIPFGGQHYPNYCDDPEVYIRRRCNEGYKELGVTKWPNKKEHIARIKYEIDMFKKVGYLNYICIIDDYIHWGTKKGIRFGLGRGSCVSSDVMYFMGCTKVDPIQHKLLFERFTNPERVTPCDVDVDVQTSRRSELIDYIKSRYGEVYQVRTFGYIKPKSACRRACQALKYDKDITDTLCKAVNSLPESLNKISDKKVRDIAKHFMGHVINYSTHASAVIVCPDAITNYTAIERQKNSKTKEYDYVVCYEFHDCEAMGLLKLDILGLQHLDIIDRVIKETGVDYAAIPNKDEKTARMIRQGHTEGVFQSESEGFTETLQKMHTEEANDVIVTNALYRPGALDSGTTKEYTLRRTGKHPVTYPVAELESALKETYGLFVYQEEVMQGARVLCGYSLGQADNVRRIIGRKIAEEMDACVADMKAKGKAIGTPEEAIDGFTKVVAASASYLFNHSHAAAYGLTAWRSAYLKAHYPIQYWCSFLEQKCKDKEFPSYIKAAQRMGINIKHPELGQRSCKVVGTGIQLGTNCIKGVGKIDSPIQKDSIEEIIKQYPSNTLTALISGGALDYFKIPRNKLIGSIDSVKKYHKDIDKWHAAIERWKVNEKYTPQQRTKRIKEYEAKIKEAKMAWKVNEEFHDTDAEQKVFGFTFGDPFKGLDLSLVNNKTVFAGVVTKFKKVTDRRGRQMAFVGIDSRDGKGMDFPMFSGVYKELKVGKPYLFGLKAKPDGYIMDSVQPLRRIG